MYPETFIPTRFSPISLLGFSRSRDKQVLLQLVQRCQFSGVTFRSCPLTRVIEVNSHCCTGDTTYD